MDFKKLDSIQAANAGFELQLEHPETGELMQAFITVLGRDSEQFRKLSAEHSKKRVQRASRGGRFNMGATMSAEEMERDTIELLAACTKSWRFVDGGKEKTTITFDGQELECTRENVKQIYTSLPWMREQVDIAVADRANFLRRS